MSDETFSLAQSLSSPGEAATPEPTPSSDLAEMSPREKFEAESAERDRKHLRSKWGGTDEDLARGAEFVGLAERRLGLDPKVFDDFAASAGHVSAFDEARHVGESLSLLPESMTPQEAHERRELLMTDKAFFERMQSGDKRALTEWRGLNWLASRR